MYHSLDNTNNSEILKHFFNKLCTVEAETVKIAVLKNLSRFEMK